MVRFCDANDLPLLQRAYDRCWRAHFPDDAPLAASDLEALTREIQLDCASSLLALEGSEPIGVLLAARRGDEALVHRLAVHPEHARHGHARTLLAALAAKAHVVAEVPGERAAACALFDHCGFTRDAQLTDYVLDPAAHAPGASGAPPDDSFLVAITLDDVLADPALGGVTARAWERSAGTLRARAQGVEGLALAALNSIAAFVLYRKLDGAGGTEIVAFRALDDEDGEAAAGCLLDSALRRTPRPLAFPAVHADELDPTWLARWGFRPSGRRVRFVRAAS